MRASDLLGARVVGPGGRSLGTVTGLECRADGAVRGALPAVRLRGLVVSGGTWGGALGYRQPGQRGPWLIRRLVELLQRGTRTVAWEDVDEVADGIVRLRREAIEPRSG
jgi:hypothetical protein